VIVIYRIADIASALYQGAGPMHIRICDAITGTNDYVIQYLIIFEVCAQAIVNVFPMYFIM